MDERADTTTRILNVAQQLAQTRGYNGFIYADIAAEVGITTASIHYHFPTKGDLAKALIGRYRAAFRQTFAAIDRAIQESLSDAGLMCLGGMLATDIATLPLEVRTEVKAFFAANEAWLTAVLADGRGRGVFRAVGAPESETRLLFAAMEGALLVARSFDDPVRFRDIARQALAGLETATMSR